MGLSDIEESTYSETWQPIADFPNYMISDLGRVFNARTNYFLTPQFNSYTGYLHVGLWCNGVGKTRSIHRLVALAFLGVPQEHLDVNHLDGDKTNNCVYNLEWCTRSANQLHAYRTGIRGPAARHGMKAVRCPEVNLIFDSVSSCAKYFDTRSSTISNCLVGNRTSWHGFTFHYAD